MRNIAVASTNELRAMLKARVMMFDNDWSDMLDIELKKQFHEKTYPKVKLMEDSSMNIFRRIVREICTVYKEPADRKVAGANEKYNQDLEDLYKKKLHIDQVMQVAHRYSKAATISFILARTKDDGNVVLRVLTPDQVYVETDPEDPTVMSLFAYCTEVADSTGKISIVWVCYTAEEIWYCNAKGEVLPVEPRSGQVYDPTNRYGVIPAVQFPAEFQVRSFYNPTWNSDAAEANLKIGLLSTYMNYLVKTQSFKQITINADSVDATLKDQILDPLFPLLLSGNAQATTLDLNTQLEAIDSVIRGKVAAIANNYGISNENFTLTTQAASGFSLKIANQALQDIRTADIPLCTWVEQNLYKVLAQMVDSISDSVDLSFNPGEVSWPEEWTTEEARWNFEFKHGIASPVDYLLTKDPDLSRPEAIDFIKERQAEIRQLKPRMSSWDLLTGASEEGTEPKTEEMGEGTNALAAVAEATEDKKQAIPAKAPDA